MSKREAAKGFEIAKRVKTVAHDMPVVPNEIWAHIFEFLDIDKLLQLRCWSRQFCEVATHILNKRKIWWNCPVDCIPAYTNQNIDLDMTTMNTTMSREVSLGVHCLTLRSCVQIVTCEPEQFVKFLDQFANLKVLRFDNSQWVASIVRVPPVAFNLHTVIVGYGLTVDLSSLQLVEHVILKGCRLRIDLTEDIKFAAKKWTMRNVAYDVGTYLKGVAVFPNLTSAIIADSDYNSGYNELSKVCFLTPLVASVKSLIIINSPKIFLLHRQHCIDNGPIDLFYGYGNVDVGNMVPITAKYFTYVVMTADQTVSPMYNFAWAHSIEGVEVIVPIFSKDAGVYWRHMFKQDSQLMRAAGLKSKMYTFFDPENLEDSKTLQNVAEFTIMHLSRHPTFLPENFIVTNNCFQFIEESLPVSDEIRRTRKDTHKLFVDDRILGLYK
jgi:hypothetical protein